MASLLQPGGTFYLSTPIGRERVVFNAHRVFDPRTIVRLANSHGLVLHHLTVISNGENPRDIVPTDAALQGLADSHYNLGIFVFVKA